MNDQTQSPGLHRTEYARDAVSVGIVHLGYGAFHRAHQAVYLDDYMQISGDLNWGIAAINLRAAESDAFLAAQAARDGYLLKTTTPEGERNLRLVRTHVEFSDWAQDAAASEAIVARASVHAISVTVTESGYYLNDDWSLNTSDPAIAAELAGGPGNSVYAYLAAALARRAEAGGAPISILCCDNIRSNGHMLERNFLNYLRLTGKDDLADWVGQHATFPCSMVDRITPRSTGELHAEISALYPGQFLAEIHAETFIQWVLEDKFAGDFPDLARAGVQVVSDVDPFEEAKIRILNGGHLGLTFLGALAGYTTFDEAMRDPALRAHFDGWETENVLPGLTIDLPFDKSAYVQDIAARFSNRAIADQLERICMDGWSKMPIYIRPTLEGCLKQGISPRFGYDCIASWYVYARRFAAGKMPVTYHEPYWTSLEPLLAPGQEETFARTQALWANLPQAYSEFVPGIVRAIKEMEEKWPA